MGQSLAIYIPTGCAKKEVDVVTFVEDARRASSQIDVMVSPYEVCADFPICDHILSSLLFRRRI